jgi:hypothetical protein
MDSHIIGDWMSDLLEQRSFEWTGKKVGVIS